PVTKALKKPLFSRLLCSTLLLFSKFRSLSTTGGSPILRNSRLIEIFLFAFAPIFQNHSFGLKPSMLLFGTGRVRLNSSFLIAFLFFRFRCGASILISAPVYRDSFAGRYFVLLQDARSTINPVIENK